MYKLVKKNNGYFRKIANNKTALNLITKDINRNISLAVITAIYLSETETTRYNRIYYILEGKLTLIINNETLILEIGDTCYLSKDSTYIIKGSFSALVINQPAFGIL